MAAAAAPAPEATAALAAAASEARTDKRKSARSEVDEVARDSRSTALVSLRAPLTESMVNNPMNGEGGFI